MASSIISRLTVDHVTTQAGLMTDTERDRTAQGAETRRKLIETAVRHFAEHGFEAASQRAIQRDAGVNPAAAHYHFGSKEAMYRAVIDTFIHDVQQERVRLHGMVPRELTGPARLHRLLRDYFEPGYAVATTPHGFHYARILARVQGERGTPTHFIFADIVRPVRALYVTSLQALFPRETPADVEEALVMGVALMSISAIGIGHGDLSPVASPADASEQLATFMGAGFQARFGPVHQS